MVKDHCMNGKDHCTEGKNQYRQNIICRATPQNVENTLSSMVLNTYRSCNNDLSRMSIMASAMCHCVNHVRFYAFFLANLHDFHHESLIQVKKNNYSI